MKLPVGYFQFHRDAFINYQLNRWHSLGYTRKEDIERAGSQIRSFADYVRVFSELAEASAEQGRLKSAAFYVRAAEFLVAPHDDRKLPLYDRFIALFYEAFEDESIDRQLVPYEGGHLPAIRLAPRGDGAESKGVVVGFGGFDSFIEEFYGVWTSLAEAGYEVIAFEGPGQGGALRTHGLAFDHDWEKPTRAVLDYFDVDDVALLGISMGGYWCLRAAAFEQRIRRVISFPPVYDWMEMAGSFSRRLVPQLMKMRRLMNFLVRLKMANGRLRHAINQGRFITQQEQPIGVVDWMLGMNKEHLHSERVEQDVLLLGGQNDAFQPPTLLVRQQEALVNARSITTRIFTEAEHAGQHCQIGNLGLAIGVMVDWMDE